MNATATGARSTDRVRQMIENRLLTLMPLLDQTSGRAQVFHRASSRSAAGPPTHRLGDNGGLINLRYARRKSVPNQLGLNFNNSFKVKASSGSEGGLRCSMACLQCPRIRLSAASPRATDGTCKPCAGPMNWAFPRLG